MLERTAHSPMMPKTGSIQPLLARYLSSLECYRRFLTRDIRKAESVHKMRVLTRRLRQVLGVMDGVLGKALPTGGPGKSAC